jgi:hypothetical protein
MPFSVPEGLEMKEGADATLAHNLTCITQLYGWKTYEVSTGWGYPELRHTLAQVTDCTFKAKS